MTGKALRMTGRVKFARLVSVVAVLVVLCMALGASVAFSDEHGDTEGSGSNASWTLGDINHNGKVNIVDAQIAFDMGNQVWDAEDGTQYGKLLDALSCGWDAATLKTVADVNGDGDVNALDARAIQHFVLYGELGSSDLVCTAPANLVYDGTAKAVTFASGKERLGTITAEYSADGVTWSAQAPTAVGTYQVRAKVAASEGFAGQVVYDDAWTFTIARAQLAVRGTTVAEKTWDGTTDAVATVGTVSGVVAGDEGAVEVTATATFADAGAGADKAVTVIYSLTGDAADRYVAPEGEELTASIDAKPIDGAAVEGVDDFYEWNNRENDLPAAAIEPVPQVSLKGNALERDVDYTIEYADNVNAGTATMTITGTGNYAGTVTKTFGIRVSRNIGFTSTHVYSNELIATESSVVSFTCPTDNDVAYAYNGYISATSGAWWGNATSFVNALNNAGLTPSDPAMGAYGTWRLLSLGSTGVFGVGDAEAWQEASGGATSFGNVSSLWYSDSDPNSSSLLKAFAWSCANGERISCEKTPPTITTTRAYLGFVVIWDPAADLSAATVSGIDGAYEYTGEAINPSPAVTVRGKTLKRGSDYTVEYSSNVNAGTATLTIKPVEGSNCISEKTVTFEINKAPLTVSGTTVADKTYDGSASAAATAGAGFGVKAADEGNVVIEANAAFADANVGADKPVTVTYALSGSAAGNYYVASGDTLTASISTADLGSATISGVDETYEWTGGAIEPEPVITLGGPVLPGGTDYTVEYASNTDIGTATMTITGIGNCTGTITKSFAIAKAAIDGATVSGVDGSYEWTGSAITPVPTLEYCGSALAEGTDYEVEYASNTDIGTATITFTGIGKFAGTSTKTFEITKRQLAVSGTVVADKVYDGTKSATVTRGDVSGVLPGDEDGVTVTATASFVDAEAGPSKAAVVSYAIEGTACDKYLAPVSEELSATIACAPITPGMVGGVDDEVYAGSPFTPVPTVTFGGTLLLAGTDYTCSYENNALPGTATVTVAGKGNFAGSVDVDFAIAKAARSRIAVGSVPSLSYAGRQLTPVPDVTLDGVALKAGADFTCEYGENLMPGTTGTVTVKGVSFEGEFVREFAITEALQGDVTAEAIADQQYTGGQITPVPAITIDGAALAAGTDFACSYGTNTAVGTGTVTVTGITFDGTLDLTFNIVKRQLTVSGTTVADKAYDGTTAATATLGEVSGVAEADKSSVTVTPTAVFADASLGDSKVVTVSYAVSGAAAGNYVAPATETTEASIFRSTVERATVTFEKPAYTWTGEAIEPVPTVTLDGMTLVKDDDYTVTYADNTDVGTGTATFEGIGNYCGSITASFGIYYHTFGVTIDDAGVTLYSDESDSGSAWSAFVGNQFTVGGTAYTIAIKDDKVVATYVDGDSEPAYKRVFNASKTEVASTDIVSAGDKFYLAVPPVEYTLTGAGVPEGTTITLNSDDLLKSSTKIYKYPTGRWTGYNVTAYNGFISYTAYSNWYDATAFVALLNSKGVTPLGSTSGTWRLLANNDDASAWYSASGCQQSFGTVQNVFSSYVPWQDTSEACVLLCGNSGYYYAFGKTSSTARMGFVVVWHPATS